MNVKEFKTLDEQIEYLENDKKIVFDDRERAREFLLNNNYYNVISCSKIYFCTHFLGTKHQYEPVLFKEWMDCYKIDTLVSWFLLDNLLLIEKELNSRLAYFLSFLIKNKGDFTLTEHHLVEIETLINDRKKGINIPYQLNNTWIYIASLSFNSTLDCIAIIKSILDRKKDSQFYATHNSTIELEKIYNQILGSKIPKEKYRELANLRNNLAHSVPISVYLTGRGNTKERKKVVQITHNYKYNNDIQPHVQHITKTTQDFLKNKRGQA